jgi:hypothetical protein
MAHEKAARQFRTISFACPKPLIAITMLKASAEPPLQP